MTNQKAWWAGYGAATPGGEGVPAGGCCIRRTISLKNQFKRSVSLRGSVSILPLLQLRYYGHQKAGEQFILAPQWQPIGTRCYVTGCEPTTAAFHLQHRGRMDADNSQEEMRLSGRR